MDCPEPREIRDADRDRVIEAPEVAGRRSRWEDTSENRPCTGQDFCYTYNSLRGGSRDVPEVECLAGQTKGDAMKGLAGTRLELGSAACTATRAWVVGLLVVMGLWVSPATLMAHPFVVDQAYTGSVNAAWYIYGAIGPSGQEFTPTLPSLGGVELLTKDIPAGNGLGASLSVDIRLDGIFGTIVGTSSPTVLSDGFDGVTHFDFPSPVALTPGTRYVIAPVIAPGGDTWRIYGSNTNPFPGGRGILSGAPTSVVDMWFREGPAEAVPEPSTVMLLVLGLAALPLLRRLPRS
jgi:hypothetical protein